MFSMKQCASERFDWLVSCFSQSFNVIFGPIYPLIDKCNTIFIFDMINAVFMSKCFLIVQKVGEDSLDGEIYSCCITYHRFIILQ